MKTTIFPVIIVIIITFLIYNCEKDSEKCKQLNLTGELVNHSSCKSGLKSNAETTDTPDSLSCIEYSFDNLNNKLAIKHINAGFNCCPSNIYCNISISGDTIIVQEFEEIPQCNCNCLFDLNIEINGVASKKYQVKFIEPYSGEQAKISFEIDLIKNIGGSFCATRKKYPWGVNSLIE